MGRAVFAGIFTVLLAALWISSTLRIQPQTPQQQATVVAEKTAIAGPTPTPTPSH